MPFPLTINLGSGKDFRADCLNIDINDYWRPDIVADVSRPFPAGGRERFATRRFGEITIEADQFDRIVCNDVLEHVPDLVATMGNCLTLLRVGGIFDITVPYDLSYGAWQDPTHVRAFNENSWLYYTEWSWYLGWDSHRFAMLSIDFVPNPLGQQMAAQNTPLDVIVRTPRAIDAMKVSLQKVVLDDEDRQRLRLHRESARS